MRPLLLLGLAGLGAMTGCAQLGGAEILAHDEAPVLGTMDRDVVALIDQESDEPGSEAHEVIHGYYRYRFASDEHARRFASRPERYRIQLGGACARMGALSGAGSTDLHAVHDGRIFLFASEGCRRGFLEEPDVCLMPARDELPSGRRYAIGDEARSRFEAMKARLAPSARSVRWDLIPRPGQEDIGTERNEWFGDGGRFTGVTRHGDQGQLYVVEPQRTLVADEFGLRELMPSQDRALRRRVLSNVNALFQAATLANVVGIRLVERDGLAETQMTLVVDGFLHEIAYDRDGSVLSHEYLGRGSESRVGWVRDEFVRWTSAGPLAVPVSWRRSFAGGPPELVDRIQDGWAVRVGGPRPVY